MHSLFRSLLAAAPVVSTAAGQEKSITLRRFPNGITVDGSIEAQWSFADSVSDFVQLQPFYGREPSRRTVAKILTTVDALYSLNVCRALMPELLLK